MVTRSVLAASSEPPPAPALLGYARVGSDLVLGEDGRRLHGDVAPGGDGAYVSVVTEGGASVVGVDHTGYAKTYLYKDGDRWALGTSFIELAESVAAKGWPLTIDATQLRTFLLRPRGMIGAQLTSHRTSLRQIRLLAPHEEAVVTAAGQGSSITTRFTTLDPLPDYRTALTTALHEMVGFLGALLDSDVPVQSDLTGGQDSRAVLAGLLAAHGTDPRSLGDRVRFRTGNGDPADVAVSEHLDQMYGLQVNRPITWATRGVEPAAGFEQWRRQDLGVNAAVYTIARHADVVSLTGAGGGSHRTTYRMSTLGDQIRAQKTDLLTDEDVDALVAATEETLASIPGEGDPGVTHYQLFRSRFHGGRTPLRTVSLSPLDSAAFRAASRLLPTDALRRSQLSADIRLNLAPVLAMQDYDTPAKGLTTVQEQHLTRVAVDPEAVQGRVFGSLPEGPAERTSRNDTLMPFREAFEEVAADVATSGLVPPEVVEQGRTAFEEATPRAFSHAVEGAPVALTLLTGELMRLTR